MTKNTPRQPSRSPTTPANDDPSRLPVMTAASQRPIATWRSFIGTRSPITAIPTGKMPPAAAPATMRATSSTVKFCRKPARGHRHDGHRQARDHHAHLADHIADRAQHRLYERERQGEGRGQQRNRVRIHMDVMRDRRNDRVGRTRGERRDETDNREPQDQAAGLARLWNLRGKFRLGLRRDRQKAAVDRAAGIEFGLKIHWLAKVIHDFQRFCCAVREWLTPQSRGAGIGRCFW